MTLRVAMPVRPMNSTVTEPRAAAPFPSPSTACSSSRGASSARRDCCLRQHSCFPVPHCPKALARRSPRTRTAAVGEGGREAPGRAGDGDKGPSVEARLALLELYTSGSEDEGEAEAEEAERNTADPDTRPAQTIADRLAKQVQVVVNDEVTIPIGPPQRLVRRSTRPVTAAQLRNLKRAQYLEESGRRNDSTFFTIVAASVLLPPFVILALAYAAGYLEFLT